MIDVQQISNLVLEKFFKNYDLEQEIIQNILEIKNIKDYHKVVSDYSESAIEDVVTIKHKNRIEMLATFRNLKPIKVDMDFI